MKRTDNRLRGLGIHTLCLALLALWAVAIGASTSQAAKPKNPPGHVPPGPPAATVPAGNSAANAGADSKTSLKTLPPVRIQYLPWGQVSSVSGEVALATGSSPPGKVQFRGSPQWIVGQRVWINAARKTAIAVVFPMQADRRDNLGNSHYMQTHITASSPSRSDPDHGRIDGKTRTWSKEALRGFEGGVVVFLMDDRGNILYNTPLHKYGVNGEAVPGASSDRTALWTETVKKDVLAQARSLAIVHLDAPTSHWDDFVAKSKDVLELAKTVAAIYGEVKGGGGPGGPGGPGGGTTPGQSSTAATGPHLRR